MIRCISVLVTALLLTYGLYAQDTSNITVPTSPAFSILDFEPSSVMRPTNAKALAADVLNSFDQNGKLLMNLGLEVAPYWLKSHPKLDRATYLEPNFGQTFLQSLSLSAATVKDSASGTNKLGGGFRFKLSNGKPVDELATASAEFQTKKTVVATINAVRALVGTGINTKQKAVDAIEAALVQGGTDTSLINKFKAEAATLAPAYPETNTGITDFLIKLLTDRVEAYGELAKKVSRLLYERKGFIVELAGALSYTASQNNSLDKTGFWANASYFVSPEDLFTLTARYLFRNTDSAITNFDVGLGFLKKASNYNISVEAMLRHYRAEIPVNNQPSKRIEKDFTYRLAVQGSYMINKDISINISFGKDFYSPFISRSGFFSILGFNYSLFSKKPPIQAE
ncbi:MAG: hypothetical protein JWP81_4438 [Ferruginibacter sp.]|nr:hypothetical protein [Ferruginibacter sp.]